MSYCPKNRVYHGGGGGLISLGFIKKPTSHSIENMYLLYIFSPEQHTYDSVVLTSLTQPTQILLFVLQQKLTPQCSKTFFP
jgi:hypothetical protein